MQDVKLEISLRSILIFVAVVAALWLLYQIKEVIVILAFAFILMSALNPVVDKLEKKMPRTLAIMLSYLAMILIVGLLLAVVIPVLISQIGLFFKNLPAIINNLLPTFSFLKNSGEQYNIIIASQDLVNLLSQQFSLFSSNLFNATFELVNGVVGIVAVSVFSFYLLLEQRDLKKQFINLFPAGSQERIFNLILKIETKLGAWLRGQAFLCFIVGFLSWIGLTVLHVDFALPLAIIAGFLEIIPNIGPIISAIPAILVALVSSPILALLTAIWYILVQQAENAFIVPKIMSSAVDLNPLIVILAILIGGKLMGVTGVLLSIPVMAVCFTILEDYLEYRKQ